MFADRWEAGQMLAKKIVAEMDAMPEVVLALPRGGVPVGHQISVATGAIIDVVITRKLGAPGNPELAIGAVASDGTLVKHEHLIRYLGVTEEYLERETQRQLEEIKRRLTKYRGEKPQPELAGKTVVVVDDGIATGYTMEAALAYVRKSGPRNLLMAVPVAPRESLDRLRAGCDRIICLHMPDQFYAVGEFYRDFEPPSDEEIRRILGIQDV